MNKKKLFNKTPLLVAEIAQSHDGSLNYVHSFIDEAYKAGADVIKFQTHFAEEESTYNDKFRTFTSYKKESRFEYWKRMEFSPIEWMQIKRHIKKKGLLFSSSVFSIKSIEVLQKIGVDIWKIASGESLNLSMIKEITKRSQKPIFVSTGMNNDKEIKNIYNYLIKRKNLFLLMHCVSEYPCNLKNISFKTLDDFKRKYNCYLGYSDHSGVLNIPLMAATKEIQALEVHVTFNKDLYNPDSSSSINFEELKFISNFIKLKNQINRNKITKNELSKKFQKNRILFSKSLAFKKDMKKKQIIKLNDLTFKKPGNGIKEKDIKNILGKKLKKDVSKNYLLKLTDVEKK